MAYPIRRLPVLAAVVLGALGACASINQNLRIAPLATDYPVSASASLYVDGRSISTDQIQVIKEFTFTKSYAPRITEEEALLDLTTEIDAVMTETGANAVVKLRIGVVRTDTNAVTWIAFERYLGVVALGGAVGLAYMAATYSGDGPSGSLTLSVALGGLGAAALGGSFLHQHLGTVGYTVRVDGVAVRY